MKPKEEVNKMLVLTWRSVCVSSAACSGLDLNDLSDYCRLTRSHRCREAGLSVGQGGVAVKESMPTATVRRM